MTTDEMSIDLYEIEAALREKGLKLICGVDEAGRGPLCGPVAAAAVILPEGLKIEGLNDSKKLTEKKREKLYDEMMSLPLYYGMTDQDAEDVIAAVKKLVDYYRK